MAPSNTLPSYGNEKTMNLNPLVLTNIQSSPYFKVNLFELKTYHEVIDEIYYKVNHLEPWEKGSRKTAGQTGMCGGVRGVGAGGIVSSAYCLLYKLYTLKLTRKQLTGVLNHTDSPYIRGLGFMYIRYSQPPADFWEWFSPYLEDEEEIDVRAGGGCNITIGEMVRMFITKLEWYSTLFPRIPVPIQKDLDQKLKAYDEEKRLSRLAEAGRSGGDGAAAGGGAEANNHHEPQREDWGRPAPTARDSALHGHRGSELERERSSRHSESKSRDRRAKSRSRERSHKHLHRPSAERREREKNRSRSRDRSRKHRSRSKVRRHRSRSRDRHHDRGSSHLDSKSRGGGAREDSFERDLARERERQRRERERHY